MSAQNQRPRFKNTIHLWEFLLELLNNERYASIISWTRRENGEFKLTKQEEVARQWGLLKQRKGMTYEKLSRSLRYYYDKKIIKKVSGQRLVYRFLELPFEYLPLRNMDEKTRRQQLQSSSSVLIPTNLNSTQSPTRSTSSPVETDESTRQIKANQIQSPETRDSGHVTLSLPPRVMSRSQIMFPSCGCIMMNSSHVIKL